MTPTRPTPNRWDTLMAPPPLHGPWTPLADATRATRPVGRTARAPGCRQAPPGRDPAPAEILLPRQGHRQGTGDTFSGARRRLSGAGVSRPSLESAASVPASHRDSIVVPAVDQIRCRVSPRPTGAAESPRFGSGGQAAFDDTK